MDAYENNFKRIKKYSIRYNYGLRVKEMLSKCDDPGSNPLTTHKRGCVIQWESETGKSLEFHVPACLV